MKTRLLSTLALAVAFAVTPARAQEAPAGVLGGFGTYTFFDEALGVDDDVGMGGRLGVYFIRNLMLEGDISSSSVDGPGAAGTHHTPARARLVYTAPLAERFAVLLGAGFTHNSYKVKGGGPGVAERSPSDNGVHGLLGLRIGLLDNVAIRLEGLADYIPSPADDLVSEDNYLTFTARAGLSLIYGGAPRPRDSDGDGVMDDVDACPGTAMGERVDARGCPIPRDADGDGVVDANDRCPNTPSGERVDARGCPIPKDSDGDGVMDPDDRCPNTARGEQVDARGCPVLFEPGETRLVLEGVNFELNSAELTPNARNILDRVAESLVANPDVRVEISGYTDSTGARAYNVDLSQRRAESVRTYLIGKDVAADRMVAKGYGPDDPVASNTTREGRAKNRRVELRRLN